jgi:hypothetical protein
MKIKITPKDKRLLKDPAVRKWLKITERRIERIMKRVEEDAFGNLCLFLPDTHFKFLKK